MQLEEITNGLRTLLIEQHYNPKTLVFYEREWKKIHRFLLDVYGSSDFDMERGLKYLENHYGIISGYNSGNLSQQRVQLLRVVHMLEDYSIHGVLTRRFYASKNPIVLTSYYNCIHECYLAALENSELSASTKQHYTTISKVFLDYLFQLKITDISSLSMDNCNCYLKTLAGLSFKTVEQNVCGIRHFLRFLLSEDLIHEDFPSRIHMPPVSKAAKIPSAWSIDELKSMIAVIDRSNPMGKRDYAMIVLACVLGLRIGDIKNLRYSNFNWESKTLSIIQHKTHKPLSLPIPDSVGWAVIDYIKNGCPSYDGSDIIFVKHMPPFDPIGDSNHLGCRIQFYLRKAGIDQRGKKHSGFHSLRHSTGSMLLEMETPLPVITTILGHSDSDITAVYLKTDLEKLAQCVLELEDFAYD